MSREEKSIRRDRGGFHEGSGWCGGDGSSRLVFEKGVVIFVRQ